MSTRCRRFVFAAFFPARRARAVRSSAVTGCDTWRGTDSRPAANAFPIRSWSHCRSRRRSSSVRM